MKAGYLFWPCMNYHQPPRKLALTACKLITTFVYVQV